MKDSPQRTTRGHGLIEPLLARLRARQANRLIPNHARSGQILDVGCGSYPYFLSHTEFKRRFAVDQLIPAASIPEISWHGADLNANPKLPFSSQYFNVVTTLAVVEHLNPDSLALLLGDVYRVLQPGGMLMVTTPASWSDGLLHQMARVGLVSKEEIHEHVYAYTLPLLGWYFGRAGFEMQKTRFGYFEFMLNMWATAIR